MLQQGTLTKTHLNSFYNPNHPQDPLLPFRNQIRQYNKENPESKLYLKGEMPISRITDYFRFRKK